MHIHETPQDSSSSGMRVDVGTLWTLQRHSDLASCTLIWLPRTWEVRVMIDDEPLLSRRCRRQTDVVAAAKLWRTTLRERGWLDAG